MLMLFKELDTIKKCSKCREIKELDKFSVIKRNVDGTPKYYNSWCNVCRVNNNRLQKGVAKRIFTVIDYLSEHKECGSCHMMLSFTEFSPSSRGSGGLAAYCKPCHKLRYYDKTKAKEATQRYRDNNRFKWRAAHRLNQFNRRSLIKATNDGSLTNEVLAEIYSKEHCYWCGKFTDEKDRTLEHIIELSNGGKHSVSNVTMACKSCNSSRLNKEAKLNAN